MIFVVIAPTLLAQGGANCKNVGGAVLTNFLDQTTTLGTATVLSLSSGRAARCFFTIITTG
jgi:hypothetical protein